MTYRTLFFATFGNTPPAQRVWDVIEKAYTQPHRAYHTLQHLNEMAEHFTALLKLYPEMPSSIRRVWVATIGIHDIVYRIGVPSGENEQISALIGRRLFLEHNLLTDDEAEVAYDWTLATASHTPHPNAPYLNLFLTSDMAILISDNQRYAEYAMQLILEYTGVSADELVQWKVPDDKKASLKAYIKGRRAWLNKQNPETTDERFANWPLKATALALPNNWVRPPRTAYQNMMWELDYFLEVAETTTDEYLA